MSLLPPFSTQHWKITHWLLILLLGAGVVAAVVGMLRPQMDERLYAKYRELPQAQFIRDGDTTLTAASAAFNLKRYGQAQVLFAAYTSGQYRNQARFFESLCLLEHNKMRDAEALLIDVQHDSNLQAETIWYLALSHLRRHDRVGCVDLLEKYPVDGPRNASKGRLLGKLGYR